MSIKITNEIFIEKAKKIHSDEYIYDLCNYKSAKEKVKIICRNHGIFLITPNSHISSSKSGCRLCGIEKTKNKKKEKRFLGLIEDMKKIHKDLYDYSLISRDIYKGMKRKVPVICKKHGVFKITPVKHISMLQGCKKCANESYYIKDFIERANRIHIRYEYDYTNTVYLGMDKELVINCKKHGDFSVLARYFLDKGRGCKKCKISDNNKSVKESNWLDLYQIKESYRNVMINFKGRYYNVDGIDWENNIVYEFYGDFFHGNPNKYKKDDINPLLKETYGSLYSKTIEREKYIEKCGYTIIKIWESEFNNLKNK
jgi:hypothetical protein